MVKSERSGGRDVSKRVSHTQCSPEKGGVGGPTMLSDATRDMVVTDVIGIHWSAHLTDTKPKARPRKGDGGGTKHEVKLQHRMADHSYVAEK